MPEAHPKLSETLLARRHPNTCQSCGVRGIITDHETASFERPLIVWRECNMHDKPMTTVIVLCRKCSKKIIGPHPRLYLDLPANAPRPGSMPTCGDCKLCVDLRCTHPDLKQNGGPGLILNFPKPTTAHLLFSGCRGGYLTLYHGPVVCQGKEPIDEK
jgi:hypothetical protein